MALLFVAGVMNLLWVAAIAGFVLLEKLVRGGAVARAGRRGWRCCAGACGCSVA